MKTFRIVSLIVFLTTVVVLPPGPGQAAVVDPLLVCIALKTTGLGAPHVDLTLVALFLTQRSLEARRWKGGIQGIRIAGDQIQIPAELRASRDIRIAHGR